MLTAGGSCAYCETQHLREHAEAVAEKAKATRALALMAFYGAFRCDGCGVEYGTTRTYPTVPRPTTQWHAETCALVIGDKVTLCGRCVSAGALALEDEERRHRFAKHVAELKASEPKEGTMIEVDVTDGTRTERVRVPFKG
jgi:hypothetical protein